MPSILHETGTFNLSSHGLYKALIFCGPPDFIERCKNFSLNYGLIRNLKKSFYAINNFGTTETHYILSPEKRILNAFRECIRGEMLLAGVARKGVKIEENEDFYQISVDRDENEFEQLAQQKAEQFLTEQLIREDYNFHFDRETLFYPYRDANKREKNKKEELEKDFTAEDMDGDNYRRIIDQIEEFRR